MKHVNVEIQGTTPLLLNRFTDEAQQDATNGTRTSIVGGNRGTPQEIAESKLYKDLNGKNCVPGPNLFRAIIDAGAFFKAGKSKITTQKSSLIPAALNLPETTMVIKHNDPWSVDSRPIRNPATGGRRLAHRPCFNDWTLKFSLEIDEELIHEKTVRDIVDCAGKRIGLGDFRPACKGPFGRFVVTKWIES